MPMEYSRNLPTCEPLVLGPALAIDKSPGRLCLNLKFSSTETIEGDDKMDEVGCHTVEHLSKYGLSASTIMMSEISTLEHKLGVCERL